MATELMLDALFPASDPAQLIADINAVGASGAFVYVWRPGGVGNWTPALAQALRDAGKRAVPIIVPATFGGDIAGQLNAAGAFGFSSGPITLDLEPPNLPPAGWEESFDSAARARGFTDLDYGTDTNLGMYQPDDEHWQARWIESGTLAVIPTLPAGLDAWQFVNDVVINGTQYDVSVVNDAIFGGGGPMPVDQHLVSANPVHGKTLAGAQWFNWGDAVNGSLVPVVGFPEPTVGQEVTSFEFVLFGGQWYDRIGPVPGQGDWCIPDRFVDTLDVEGCLDPPSCVAKVNPPPPSPPPPPPPPPPPTDVVTRAEFDALKTAFDAHRHDATTSGTTGAQHQ